MQRDRFYNAVVTLLSVAGMYAIASCGGINWDDSTRTSTQELTGTVPDEAGATAVVAVDESGERRVVTPDEDGGFALELPTGHTYELFVSEEGEEGLDQASQIVFPRANGEIDDTVTIGGAMAPFDLGEVRPAGTLDTANFQAAEDRVSCNEGIPGLFCVHDGLHPGCEGLAIAAANRADARRNAADAADHADDSREDEGEGGPGMELPDAASDHAGDHIPEDPRDTLDDESEERDLPVEPEQPIALPQFNPPFEFPGCSQ